MTESISACACMKTTGFCAMANMNVLIAETVCEGRTELTCQIRDGDALKFVGATYSIRTTSVNCCCCPLEYLLPLVVQIALFKNCRRKTCARITLSLSLARVRILLVCGSRITANQSLLDKGIRSLQVFYCDFSPLSNKPFEAHARKPLGKVFHCCIVMVSLVFSH